MRENPYAEEEPVHAHGCCKSGDERNPHAKPFMPRCSQEKKAPSRQNERAQRRGWGVIDHERDVFDLEAGGGTPLEEEDADEADGGSCDRKDSRHEGAFSPISHVERHYIKLGVRRESSSAARGSMNAKAVGYWTCTVLVAFFFLSGGAVGLARIPQSIEGITHLGYPVYLVTILSVWKVLGGVVVLLPGFALIKEWAYAGMIFDLTGATASHAACGDDIRHILIPLVIALFVAASWALRPEGRRLT